MVQYLLKLAQIPLSEGIFEEAGPDEEEDLENDGDDVEEAAEGVAQYDESADQGFKQAEDAYSHDPVGLDEMMVTLSQGMSKLRY